MRRALIAFTILAMPLLAFAVFSETYRIDLSQYNRVFQPEGKFDKPVFENSSYIYSPGAFKIPYYTFIYALPPGMSADSVAEYTVYKRKLSGRFMLSRLEKARSLSTGDEIDLKNSSFSLKSREGAPFISGLAESGGVILAHLSFPAIIYDSVSGEVEIIDSVSFMISEFEHAPLTEGSGGIDRKFLPLISNPEDAFFQPDEKGSSYILDSIIDFVILADTSDINGTDHPELIRPLQKLADWKTRTGIPAKVFTLDYVEGMFSGESAVEKIKSFIDFMHSSYGTKYLLLVGEDDSDNDDPRSAYAENDVGSWMPRYEEFVFDPFEDGYIDADTVITDYYFSDLNGDDYIDVKTGRLLFDEYSKAFQVCSLFAERIIKHESDPEAGYLGKMLLITENLYEGYPGKILAESVAFYNPPGMSEIKMYDEDGGYDDDAAIGIMNSGIGIQMASAHGCEYAYVLNNKNSIAISDIESGLNSSGRTFFFLGIPCWIGAYDYDCLAEHMLCHPLGGAVGGLFNTRYGFGTIDYAGRSEWLTLEFIKNLSSTTLFRTGDLKAAMNDAAVKYLSLDPAAEWCSRAYNLFGDPTMILYPGEPQRMRVAHPLSVDSSGYFYVIATDSLSGTPIPNALVTLSCTADSLMYLRGITDINGSTVFYIDPSVSSDTVIVSLVKKSYVVHISKAPVLLRPPERCTIVSPFDDCAFSGLPPVLRFSSKDAQGDRLIYKVEIDDSRYFDSPMTFYTGEYDSGDTAALIPAGLALSTLYFWRVSARDFEGSDKYGELSEIRCFHLLPSSSSPYICKYKSDSIQFSQDDIYQLSLSNDEVVLAEKDYFIYERRFFSDFEYNMIDSSWSVLDSNFDNVKWHSGLTMQSALAGYEPPNASTYYLYYSDSEIRGSKYKFSNEQVHSGSIFTGDCDSLYMSYSYGFYLKQTTESFSMCAAVFKGGAWSSWYTINSLEGNSTGSIINNLSWLLPCDSLKFSFIYRNSGKKGGGVAVDNVAVTAVYRPDYDYGILISESVSFKDLNLAAQRSSWGKIEYEKIMPEDSILMTVEYLSGDVWTEVPDAALSGNSVGFYSASAASEIDISALDPKVYDPLRIALKFYRKSGSPGQLPGILSYSLALFEQSATMLCSASLTGRCTDKGILIEWSSELPENAHLIRGSGADRVILPAKIKSESYLDTDVSPGDAYTYVISYSSAGIEYTSESIRILYPLSGKAELMSNISSGKVIILLSEGSFDSGGLTFSLYDISGRCIVKNSRLQNNGLSAEIDLTGKGMASGYYSLKLMKNGKNILNSQLLIIK